VRKNDRGAKGVFGSVGKQATEPQREELSTSRKLYAGGYRSRETWEMKVGVKIRATKLDGSHPEHY
jgi:hypothetical protein